MSINITTGAPSGASTIAAALAFIGIGGRLLIDPQGRYRSTIDMAALLETSRRREVDPSVFAERRVIAGKFVRVQRRHRKRLAQLARENGQPVNGWLVWEDATC